ncbi:XAC2610-related protein [Pedobacter sp. BG31]|uniref:XAC2610-related protein n=1 Tax=Pedobacter sp. BG31 TaxID=3349697 RepID=UPI0035F346C0
MTKTILIVILAMIFGQANAQKAKLTANLNFTGNIGKYPIEMKLSLNNYNDSIFGEYYYIKNGYGSKLYLEGTLKDDKMFLKESAYNAKSKKNETTGYFKMAYILQKALAGSWGEKPNREKTLDIKFQCRENLQAFNPLSFDFIMLKTKPDEDSMTENSVGYSTLLSLKINANKNSGWILHDFDKYDLVKDKVELEDVNFDGYLDIKLPVFYPDRIKGDYGYVYFVYDVTRKSFIKNKTLDDLGVVFFDSFKKQIYKYDADGNGNEGKMYYRWQNGKLLLQKAERVYENDIYTHYEEYKIENGRSVKVRDYKKRG